MTRRWLAVVLATTAGCPSAPSPDQQADLSIACDLLADAGTSAQVRCGALFAGAREGVMADATRDCRRFNAGVRDGGAHLVPAQFAACLLDLTDAPCALVTAAHCDGIFVGNGAAGSTCVLPTQCQPGLACDFSLTCPGRCVPGGQAGAPLSAACNANPATGTLVLCEPFLECRDGTCQRPLPKATVGTACLVRPNEVDPPNPCELGAVCFDGRCVALGGLDGGCPCQNGLTCELGKCVDPSGPPCGAVHCTPDEFCRNGFCVRRLPEGASCSPFSLECAAGLSCDGTCRAPRQLGESCSTLTPIPCVRGLVCQAGVCHPPAALGESCQSTPCAEEFNCTGAIDRAVCTLRCGF
ncbi:MAG: hypothetical protein U0228_14425 [Myxococcaceae bacterium]